MRVPLTTRDFLDRAELVYGDRVGIVDEPAQPAPSLGEVTYREVARRARAMQAALDGLGIWGGGGGSPSSATTPAGWWRCCWASRRRVGCSCPSTSACRRKRSPTSWATP